MSNSGLKMFKERIICKKDFEYIERIAVLTLAT